MRGTIYVVSGPSGAGKTSILKEALKNFNNLEFSVSYTTRSPRPGEVDGKDYFYISGSEFKDLINKDEFLEWAEVHGNLYGTSRSFMEAKLEQGISIILDIDVQGALSVMKKMPEAAFIFVSPPSFQDLKKRLTDRNTETSEDLALRLGDAKWELSHVKDFNYLIINRDLNESIKQLESIIIAERIRIDRMKDHLG